MDANLNDYDNDTIPGYEREAYQDAEGFHWSELIVPSKCTLESLGVHYDAAREYGARIEAWKKATAE